MSKQHLHNSLNGAQHRMLLSKTWSIKAWRQGFLAMTSKLLTKTPREDLHTQLMRLRPSKTYEKLWETVHQPLGLVAFPCWLLGTTAGALDIPDPIWMPVAFGAMLGAVFAALNRYSAVRIHAPPRKPLSVVITGGSKGLGKALARELLLCGDRVILTSRTQSGADRTVAQLRQELKQELGPRIPVYGFVCDVSDPADVLALDSHARRMLSQVDVWINNAAYSGSFQPFSDTQADQLQQVVRTNLLGSVLCSRQAVRLFSRQPGGGHLFNVDGAGADGFATPNYAAYGATKAGIHQLSISLQAELKDSPVRVHLLSPGMILTDLLLEGASAANKQAFNILCEQPETTAAFLVPRIRTVVARDLRDTYVKYLTPASALWRLLTAPARIGKYFDAAGNPVYPDELERMYGRGAKATARKVAAARRQNTELQVAYSLSLVLAVAVLVADAHAGGLANLGL
ncbi:hypothetical protein V8C86DRAFT_2610769 [Haematococcus lacustris]